MIKILLQAQIYIQNEKVLLFASLMSNLLLPSLVSFMHNEDIKIKVKFKFISTLFAFSFASLLLIRVKFPYITKLFSQLRLPLQRISITKPSELDNNSHETFSTLIFLTFIEKILCFCGKNIKKTLDDHFIFCHKLLAPKFIFVMENIRIKASFSSWNFT